MKKLILFTVAAIMAMSCFTAVYASTDDGAEDTAFEPTVFEVPTVPVTFKPTEPATEAPTEAPTESATEPGDELSAPSSEPYKEEPVYNEHHNRICGKKQKDGSIKFIPTKGNAFATGNDLFYLLSGNKKRTIVLPKKKISIQRVLMPGNNKTLIATGATIYQTDKNKTLVVSPVDLKTKKQTPVKNLKIIGGKWRIKGYATRKTATSTFRFLHSSNITLKKCDIQTNYKSHAVELIACKKVTVDGCKLIAVGKTKSDSLEEALQIDIATTDTTDNILAKYLKGQTCGNITVKNCVIKGSRGVCANRTDKWLKKHHKNIKLIGNTITGVTSEAVALHNTAGITVKNNKIISKGSRINTTYSIGVNIASFGKTSAISKKSVTVTGNTIKGGRQAIQVVTYKNTTSGVYGSHKFGKVTIKNNKLYCKKGKGNCILTKNCKSVKKSGNKLYKW